MQIMIGVLGGGMVNCGATIPALIENSNAGIILFGSSSEKFGS